MSAHAPRIGLALLGLGLNSAWIGGLPVPAGIALLGLGLLQWLVFNAHVSCVRFCMENSWSRMCMAGTEARAAGGIITFKRVSTCHHPLFFLTECHSASSMCLCNDAKSVCLSASSMSHLLI